MNREKSLAQRRKNGRSPIMFSQHNNWEMDQCDVPSIIGRVLATQETM